MHAYHDVEEAEKSGSVRLKLGSVRCRNRGFCALIAVCTQRGSDVTYCVLFGMHSHSPDLGGRMVRVGVRVAMVGDADRGCNVRTKLGGEGQKYMGGLTFLWLDKEL